MGEKVVLAYSGGLDTSVAVRWLKEKYDLDVITLTIDVGNIAEVGTVKEKAKNAGAIDAVVVNAQEDFVKYFIYPALKANLLYEGQYPLATALARPLMAKLQVDVARKYGATTVAHGCTGKGNDQVRFEVSVNALAPDLKILAPAREWNMTREETINYAKKYNIPVPVTVGSPYSIDECLWGRAIECGILEDPWNEPPDDAFLWTCSPAQAPDEPTYVEIEFEKGVPVALNGEKMTGVDLIQALHKIAGSNGVGRIDHIENRLVGLKSREVYEAPAAIVLIQAHKALEHLVLAKDQLHYKDKIAVDYADMVYNGLWFSALHQDLAAFVESTQRYVTGSVRLKLFKGTCMVVGRKSPYSLYQKALATYDEGDEFDQSHSVGFITLWGLPVKIQAQVQKIAEADSPLTMK